MYSSVQAASNLRRLEELLSMMDMLETLSGHQARRIPVCGVFLQDYGMFQPMLSRIALKSGDGVNEAQHE
ncbi:MAG: hypothetical protein EXS30_06815 [Pedosphaera sp.]|nr:hypothetical protein [Pedosphaera sp.]